jgi:2-polyprenyl-6-methoxyphenol hydroxylase-like FAD-dependent oxidoreductase
MAWGDRQILLQVLFEHVCCKDKIVLGKRISNVESNPNSVKVNCTDGSSYEGDILAGADGVYSRTRQEMWRLADAAEPCRFAEDKDCKCHRCSLPPCIFQKWRRSLFILS